MSSGTEVTPNMLANIPGASYPCADATCATEVSFPAEDLTWFSGSKDPDEEGPGISSGFYCYSCEDALNIECDGFSLAYVLKHTSTGSAP